MNNILKVAKRFQHKIIFASAGNFQGLTAVYSAAMKVLSVKNLWLTAANGDPYSEAMLDQAFKKMDSTARRGYDQAMNYGMPASGPKSYAGFLTDMDASAKAVEAVGLGTHLDRMASDKLAALKMAVESARGSFLPVAIPAQNHPSAQPAAKEPMGPSKDLMGPEKEDDHSGMAYTPNDEEHSEMSYWPDNDPAKDPGSGLHYMRVDQDK